MDLNKMEQLFKEEQDQWRDKILLENSFERADVHLVAGVDLAYWSEQDKEYGVCCIVVVDYHTKEVVERTDYAGAIEVPYIPGYLAFRELPLILKAINKLRTSPDLYMFDGNGYLHTRHMGIATHAAFLIGKPTIGVAKSYYKIEGATVREPDNTLGASEWIQAHGEVYGLVLRSRKDVKPIYVSCGNWIDLETAKQITLHFVDKRSRLPMTTRLADLDTHTKRAAYQGREG